MTYVLDRFEEAFALLEAEDGTMVQIAKNLLPEDAAEGCSLQCAEGVWTLCKNDRAESIATKMNLLWQ